MLFSKSFGYALRGLLYIATCQKPGQPVQVDAIAGELGVPRFFMAKILKGLVKDGFLHSVKGPRGGFSLPPATRERALIDLLAAIDGTGLLHNCVLRLGACNAANPCPMHRYFTRIQGDVQATLEDTRLSDLLLPERAELLRSLSPESVAQPNPSSNLN
ncbi:MAG: Rrf2 family transcriptional regulator [Chitinophagaceae bacterium]|nr:MAG: Rrf2 family transcriptional regulator [Chitinophagaceae bacterium]